MVEKFFQTPNDNSTTTNHSIVILVHGTFSNHDKDDGELWWQRGSFFWKKLIEKLPSNITMIDSGSIFHWDGNNHFMSRYTAGDKLLEYIDKFDKDKIPYHIIAHSHGGSVLWSALQIAYFGTKHGRRKSGVPCELSLPYLRSCTVVATPSIWFKPLPFPITRLWIQEISTILALFGIPILLVISLWPFFYSWSLFALSIFFVLATFLEKRSFPTKFSAMQNQTEDIAKSIGSRWQSIWSSNDEAINLLQYALNIANNIKNNKQACKFENNKDHLCFNIFKPPLPIVPAEHQTWLSRIYFCFDTFLIYIWRKYLTPKLNKIASIRFVQISLGLRFFERVDKVRPYPYSMELQNRDLPSEVSAELKSEADRHLSILAPKIRQKILLAMQGVGKNPFKDISQAGRELVHTSYFHNENVINYIVDHIKEND